MMVTKHGERRVRKRLGIPKKIVNREVEQAFRYGVHYSHFSGELLGYLEKVANSQPNADFNVRVFRGTVYVFRHDKLVTAWPIPGRFRRVAHEVQSKIEASQHGSASSVEAVH